MFTNWKIMGLLSVALVASLYFNYNLTGTLGGARASASIAAETYKNNAEAFGAALAAKDQRYDSLKRDIQMRENLLAAAERDRAVLRDKLDDERTRVTVVMHADESCVAFRDARMCDGMFDVVREHAPGAPGGGHDDHGGEAVPAVGPDTTATRRGPGERHGWGALHGVSGNAQRSAAGQRYGRQAGRMGYQVLRA